MKKFCSFPKFMFLIYIILNIITAILSVTVAILIEITINAVNENQIDNFGNIILIAALFIILYFLFNYFRTNSMQKLLDKYIQNLRNLLFKKIMGYSYSSFRKLPTSDYLSLLINDVQIYQEGALKSKLYVIQYTISAIIVLFTLLSTNIYISLLVILCTIITYAIPSFFDSKISSKQKNVSMELSNITEIAQNNLEGFYVINTYRTQQKVVKKYKVVNNSYTLQKISLDKLISKSEIFSTTFSVATELVILFVSAYLVFANTLTVGSMVAIMQLTGAFVQPIMMITQNLPKISSGKALEERFLSVLTTKSNDIDKITEFTPLPFKNNIQLNSISFSYDNEKKVLNSISLILEKGKKYALLGGSGAGKTTLINVINGLYKLSSGFISVDNTKVDSENYSSYLNLFATVGQNTFLFNTTILDNITLSTEINKKRLIDVCRISGINNMLGDFKNGLETEIHDNGINLSGGQKQKIGLARALYHNKSILLLDEGLSAIDKKSAYALEEKLLEMENITLISITHDVTSPFLKKYDQIIFVDKGAVEGIGNYIKLIENEAFKSFISKLG